MTGWLDAGDDRPGSAGVRDGWTPAAGRLIAVCMVLLGIAAAWLVLTRPVHRIEGDFLRREDRLVADPWIFEQLQHSVAEIRARAVLAISRIQGGDALGLLVEAMSDPAPSVRASAAFAVGNVLDSRSSGAPVPDRVESTLLELLTDENRLVGTRAVAALGKLGRREVAADLTRTAAPITTAMTALMRIDAADQADFVAEYLDSDDQDSRWAAALAAADLRLASRPMVSERLRPLLSDANTFVRAAALRAVSFGPSDPALIAVVRDNLDNADPKVRYEAAVALAVLAGSARSSPLPSGEPVLDLVRLAAPPGSLLEPDEYQRVAKTIGARLRMSTALGDFDIELDYDQAPLTAEHFRKLASRGVLDSTVFTAVRPNGYAVAVAPLDPIRSELNPKPFLRGSLGLLRQGEASGGGFFMCLTALPLADGRYVNFGRLVSGDSLMDSIAAGIAVHSIRPVP